MRTQNKFNKFLRWLSLYFIASFSLLISVSGHGIEQDEKKELKVTHFTNDVIRGEYKQATFTARYQTPKLIFIRVKVGETSLITRLDTDEETTRTKSFGMPLTKPNKWLLSEAAKSLQNFLTEHGDNMELHSFMMVQMLDYYSNAPDYHHFK